MVSTTQQRRAIGSAFVAFVIVFILWQVADNDSILLYPFRLMVTFAHEAGHGLSAIATGGRFIEFRVFPNGSGVALTAGGNRVVILQMGYLGAALFGAVLLYTANRVRNTRLVCFMVGLFFMLCALLFTRAGGSFMTGLVIGFILLMLASALSRNAPKESQILGLVALAVVIFTFISLSGNTALLVGLIAGGLLIAISFTLAVDTLLFVLNFLALITGLNAVSDILVLTRNTDIGLGVVRNDAAALADFTNLPVQLWLAIWIVVAVGLMATSAYFAFIRPARS
jgi:hypothetical protein